MFIIVNTERCNKFINTAYIVWVEYIRNAEGDVVSAYITSVEDPNPTVLHDKEAKEFSKQFYHILEANRI